MKKPFLLYYFPSISSNISEQNRKPFEVFKQCKYSGKRLKEIAIVTENSNIMTLGNYYKAVALKMMIFLVLNLGFDRSAARTPSANKEPRYGLRYTSPAWASPSRDTMHARSGTHLS